MISPIRELSQAIRSCVQKEDIRSANEIFVEFLERLTEITSVSEKRKLQKHILTELLSACHKESFDAANNRVRHFDRTMQETAYFTTSEAAEILGVSDQTIRRMCEKGRFPEAFKTDGGHWRIPKQYFRIDVEQARQAEAFMRGIDEKNQQAGDVDEFHLI